VGQFGISANNQNQLVLESTAMKLSRWIEQREPSDVAKKNVGALDKINNEEFLNMTLAVILTLE